MKAWAAAIAMLGVACTDPVLYDWDGARVICSAKLDDIGQELEWDRVEDRLSDAADLDDAAVFHAHRPGVTVTMETIARILERAAARGLEFATFADLVADERRRPALALAFDDDDVAGWFGIRDVLEAHDARVTFFVTRWATLTADELGMLELLHAAGHDVQPHGVAHANAKDYVAEHGLDAYLAGEVIPSIQIMTDAGYDPTVFAFPFGATEPEISAGVLEHIARVRTTLSDCPH